MRSLFFSPRARRRLAWIGAGLALVAAAVTVGVKWPNTGERTSDVFEDGEAYVYKEPKATELTRADRARALATAANFVTHAVARRKVELAYDLAAPSLRAGISRAEWRKEDIPVVPFPVQEARWKIEYSYDDALGLQVLLLPTPKSRLRPTVFAMELTPTGRGKDHKWLVSSWAPTGMTGVGAPAPPQAGAGGVPNLGATLQGGEARLDARWLLAPFALLALVPLIIGGFYFRGWRRGRRAEAAYHRRAA
ncbi:MAG: hypothetical protein M3P42_01735 [Actinomycetota bacterium]|nr:hypothetical protein [Actinomycetota bacterium]